MLRFDPFSDLEHMTKTLFDAQVGTSRQPRFMPLDLYKVDDHYVLLADLPGVDPGSVDVNVDAGTLTLTAHRSAQSEENVEWLASERFSGTFRRQLSLGEGIDTAGISASYENGVLSVTIPLAERAKPRRIKVSSLGAAEHQTIEAASTDKT
ncbi:Hsp20/alpha crystallin family protein [Rhodococcus sp. NPDC049939]|uniref:Hsp20/alpha crystallin family protein n=1 Tax=Rhodococcus sp. NPDC049939 TaxID=3155511 RepID=UPI0033C3944A